MQSCMLPLPNCCPLLVLCCFLKNKYRSSGKICNSVICCFLKNEYRSSGKICNSVICCFLKNEYRSSGKICNSVNSDTMKGVLHCCCSVYQRSDLTNREVRPYWFRLTCSSPGVAINCNAIVAGINGSLHSFLENKSEIWIQLTEQLFLHGRPE